MRDYVPIETFDALLLRLWKNIDKKPPDLDARVRKAKLLMFISRCLGRGGESRYFG